MRVTGETLSNLLILGGTTEASRLASAVAGMPSVAPLLSLAGRTAQPAVAPIPTRVGGFGGAAGLAAFLRSERVDAVVDATHPFAVRIKANAAEACDTTGVPLAAFSRPAWVPGPGDRWAIVADIDAAVAQLGTVPRRVFLTTGRLDLARFKAAPQHHYTIRTIDPPDPADLPPIHTLVQARAPFDEANEQALLAAERVDCLVTKNSGGDATVAKLEAARRLGIEVIMVERPAVPQRLTFETLGAVLAWIDAQASQGRSRP